VEAVAGILSSRGIENCKTSQIVMTTGSQQGLDLIARVILVSGRCGMVELPSYIGAIIAFAQCPGPV
jgi:2-aminoadipate transaminase